MSNLSEELQAEICDFLRQKVHSGFDDPQDFPASAGEVFSDQADISEIEAFARPALQDILIDYFAEQRQWPDVTDCDRLDAAFAELESKGIIARQNFWCCGTCGLSAIGEEIAESKASGHEVRGYTFYHEQDTESAVEGHGLYLYYGAEDGVEAHSLKIAHEIEGMLQRHGLKTDWDGEFKKRLFVELDWKRRHR